MIVLVTLISLLLFIGALETILDLFGKPGSLEYYYTLPAFIIGLFAFIFLPQLVNFDVKKSIKKIDLTDRIGGDIFQITFTPRIYTGIRGMINDSDDIGYIIVDKNQINFIGDGVELFLLKKDIKSIFLVNFSIKNYLFGNKITIAFNENIQYDKLDFICRSSSNIFSLNILNKQLFKKISENFKDMNHRTSNYLGTSPKEKQKGNFMKQHLWKAIFLFLIILSIMYTRSISQNIKKLPRNLSDSISSQGFYNKKTDWKSPLLNQRKIVVTNKINQLTSEKLVSSLLYLDNASPGEPIDIYLRTVGGNTDDMYAIIETMRLIKSKVNIYAIGGCNSAGVYILAAGTGKRYCTPKTIIGIHINIEKDNDKFSISHKEMEREKAFWKKYTDIPESFYAREGNRWYFLNAEEAKKYGIIDEIIQSPSKDAAHR